MAALEGKGVSVRLGGTIVVRRATFEVAQGEVIGLLGPNAAGKSSLLRAIAGVLPFSGEISFQGISIRSLSSAERAQRIAYLPQEREMVWPVSTLDLVSLGRLPHRIPIGGRSAPDGEAVMRALKLTQTEHLAHRNVLTLSGGERARVLCARAIAQETPILLADEPVAGLDPYHQIGIMESLGAIASSGCAVLISMHDLALAGQQCDRLLLMAEGELVAEGEPAEVLTSDRLAEVYRIASHIERFGSRVAAIPTGRLDGR
jgi:iron complex transport system ATP-binding protein